MLGLDVLSELPYAEGDAIRNVDLVSREPLVLEFSAPKGEAPMGRKRTCPRC